MTPFQLELFSDFLILLTGLIFGGALTMFYLEQTDRLKSK